MTHLKRTSGDVPRSLTIYLYLETAILIERAREEKNGWLHGRPLRSNWALYHRRDAFTASMSNCLLIDDDTGLGSMSALAKPIGDVQLGWVRTQGEVTFFELMLYVIHFMQAPLAPPLLRIPTDETSAAEVGWG